MPRPEPLNVACPRCGARVGQPCVSQRNRARPWGEYHPMREVAAREARPC